MVYTHTLVLGEKKLAHHGDDGLMVLGVEQVWV